MKLFSRTLDPAPATKGNALVYALWLAGILGVMATLLQRWNNPIAQRDFAFLWLAGKLAASGHAAQAYDLNAFKAAAASYASASVTVEFPYPPHILFIAVPLSWLPITVSFFAWQALSAFLFYLAARPYLPEGMPRLLAILTPSALLNVAFGQVGLFCGALWLWCFSGSAIAAAFLTIKPQLGIIAAPEMVHKHFLLRTVTIAAAILTLSAVAFGLDSWRAFFAGAATNHLRLVGSGQYPNWYIQMTTPYLGYGLGGWLAFAAAATFLLVRRFDVFTAATASFLIAPYGFHYDMAVVCLGFGILLFRFWRSISPWQTLICALAFLCPVIVRAGTWLVPPLLLAGLYVMTSKALTEKARS